MPDSSKAKNAPVRPTPAWMSSRISRMPRASVISRRRCSHWCARDVDAALALHGLDDHRGGQVEARAPVVEHLLEQVEGVGIRSEVTVVGQARDVVEADARGAAVVAVAGRGKGAEAQSVEGVRERHDRGPAGRLAGDLECGLDGVRAGRPGELQLVVEPARREHEPLERLDEVALGRGGHVEAVDDAVALEVLDERAGERGVVVPVVEHAGPGEEVEVLAPVGVDERRSGGTVEHGRERADVSAHLRLATVEDVQCGFAAHAGVLLSRDDGGGESTLRPLAECPCTRPTASVLSRSVRGVILATIPRIEP